MFSQKIILRIITNRFFALFFRSKNHSLLATKENMASEVVTSSGGLGRIKRALLRKKIVRVFFVDPANMSDVEESPSPRSTSSSSDEKESQEHLGEVVAAGGQIAPYIDDPLADSSEDEDGAGSSEDEDGLSPSTLEARYEREVPVSTW